MSKIRHRTALVLLALMVLAVPSAYATMVLKMDLANLVDRADKVFRGTVVDVTEGTVQLGGGELPTVTYRVKVDEAFKGEYLAKGDESYAEITMIAPIKRAPDGDIVAFSKLPALPQLQKGQDYLLMANAPNHLGLSTTIGLGQGAFKVFFVEKTEMAANELNNLGLYDGPVAYADLADDIRAQLGQ